jgi:hypothetical protein
MSSTTNGLSGYRLEHPTLMDVLRDMRIPSSDPGPGDQIPTFDLPTTDRGRFSSAQFGENASPVLIVFGSQTCPVTESAGRGLVELHQKYSRSVRFVMVNVREAHPGAVIPQPRSMEQKKRHAEGLKGHHGFDFEVAIDDIDGSVHRAFGTRPSSAYLVDRDGTIVFRAHWSNVTSALDEALAAISTGRSAHRSTAGDTVRSAMKMLGHATMVFDRAGRGARADTWKAAPPVAALIALSNLFSFASPDRRGILAMVTIGSLIAGTVAVVAVISLVPA